MPLVQLKKLHLAYGPQILLDDVDLVVDKGEHIGLLGRNGVGKSSLMKILSGEVHADGGELWIRPETRIAYLSQDLPEADKQTVYEYVASGITNIGELISRFHQLTVSENPDMQIMETLQQQIDAADGWSYQQKVDTVISQLELPGEASLDSLSGGWKRRVALARALVNDPEVLLLDEPTNHLDIPAIEWLEKFLQEFRGAIVLVTHDRAFLQKVANRIMELDRGELIYWQHDYQGFLKHRDQQLAAEEKANQEFDKKLAREEAWIRQGIKARRTRNEGRVRSLKKMRQEFQQRRQVQGNANLKLNQAEMTGKIVVEVEDITHGYGGRTLIRDFSLTVLRGDRIGFIGPNGVGKTTLLKILLGELTPDHGKVKTGTRKEVAYFDQLRGQLDLEKSVRDNLAEGSDHVKVNGRDVHVISYLQDFLFAPDRIRQPVKALSGGEQNRLILARLFSKPANVLVLDEPTNDLDMETLELLEEILLEFDGTLLLVSHDRAFLDNVVTSSIVFEGNGRVGHYVGGYQDWINSGGSFELSEGKSGAKKKTEKAVKSDKQDKQDQQGSPAKKPAKLSYKVQRELDQLPDKIETAESRLAELEAQISDPAFYEQDQQEIEKTLNDVTATQEALESHYSRWEEIEKMQ